jgi:hypothetical protein
MSRREFLKKYKPSLKVIDYRPLMIAPRCRIPVQYSKNPFVGALSFPLVGNTPIYSNIKENKSLYFKVYPTSMPRIRLSRVTSYQRAQSSIKISSRYIPFPYNPKVIL